MKSLIILGVFCAFVAYSYTQTTPNEPLSEAEKEICRNWRREFSRSYDSIAKEEIACRKVLNNLKSIMAHNAKFERGEVSFSRKLYKYSDMSPEEKDEKLCGYQEQPMARAAPQLPLLNVN